MNTPTPLTPLTPLTLAQLNQAPIEQATGWLADLYEHSAWVAHKALLQRPFRTRAALQHALIQAVQSAPIEQQIALIQAHPELASKAAIAKTLTHASHQEQQQAGLLHCHPDEFAELQQLNTTYRDRFGWPFILAVRGPRGQGLKRSDIIATLRRRLESPAEIEQQECLRQIHRIAELRLHSLFQTTPTWGEAIWDECEALAHFSEPQAQAEGQLTVTYMTDAHRHAAQHLAQVMQDAGMDEVTIDVLGNVIGRYNPHPTPHPHPTPSQWLLTGSHYDTVRQGGKYDGRLGIYVALQVIRHLSKQQKRLPFGIEVVAFSEEEGQRFPIPFLSSSALIGQFDPAWLAMQDADGISLQQVLEKASSFHGIELIEAIKALARRPEAYLGFVEIHIEQGPVLSEAMLPLGIVTSINGARRFVGQIMGLASHAGTTPMMQRQDAVMALAEWACEVEQHAQQMPPAVATIGQWLVPNGSVNVIPGLVQFSLDVRAPTNEQRDALVEVLQQRLNAITERRRVRYRLDETLRVAASPCDLQWQQRWQNAITHLGLPLFMLNSGAGHDAMKMGNIMPQSMLFVRGEHRGISHNPLESVTADDANCAAQALLALVHLIENNLNL